MATLMIKCPSTGQPISTGMDLDKASFDSSTFSNNGVGCPICRQTHIWNKSDAFFLEDKKEKEKDS